jgi:DNA polymerase-3 subunit alpha
MAKSQSIKQVQPEFSDIRNWYETYLAPEKINHNDQAVYENVYHQGKWCGIFQLTSKGAQNFFMEAKPRSIVDIAALTSIYRPGPLAAKVDKLWLQHEKEPYDWGHPLINQTLEKTRGMVVFQESVMALANKVAGFPLDQTDEVRRAIMKRTTSGGEEAVKKAKKLEDDFVAGSVKNGVPENIAHEAYQRILWMAGYAFNSSHATGYAFDSYICAWLSHYYPDQWLTAYLESMSNNDENKSKALSEIKQLGYKVVPIDINYANRDWTILPGKRFMSSFGSIKGVGDSAVDEILENRPYKSIEDLLWTQDGKWRHSKFNRRALEALISIGGLDSLGAVGEDKIFSSYAHMYEVIINHSDEIKKSTKKEPNLGQKNFYELARTLRDTIQPWTRKELALKQLEFLGSVDIQNLVEPDIFETFTNKNVLGIDELEETNEPTIAWWCVTNCVPKKTKNNKDYWMLECQGSSGKIYKMFCWGVKSSDVQIEQYSICFGKVSKSNFGFSTQRWDVRVVG